MGGRVEGFATGLVYGAGTPIWFALFFEGAGYFLVALEVACHSFIFSLCPMFFRIYGKAGL